MSDLYSAKFPYLNGRLADVNGLSILDRGLAYGDGVFETIRVTRNGPVLMSYHLQRLNDGLKTLAIRLDWSSLIAELDEYPGFHEPGIVKLIITRGQGSRGYSCEQVSNPSRILTTHPEPDYPVCYYEQGVSLYPCKTKLSGNPLLAGIKHLNRLEQVLARQEWQGQQFQEGLMLDQRGNVVEGVFSNLFVVRNGLLLTPRLDQCGVFGVMRRWLLEQFSNTGYNVIESELSRDEFLNADERFYCNSVYGVWPVSRFEQNTWNIGPVTRLAQKMVSEHWCL